MPWTYANLRGNRVLARVREDGSFASDGGKVEIRYKPNDGRAYFASAANLARAAGAELFPDDHCVPGEAVAKKEGAAPGGGGQRAGEVSKGGKGTQKTTSPAPSRPGDWVAYADGACSGNPGPAGLGVVLITPDGKIHEGFEYLGHATNNIAELTAILRVLEAVPHDAKGVLIHTDSSYSIGVLQKGWKAKANQELIATIKGVLKQRSEVRLSYVPGHAGVPMNERADELAREAVKTGKSVDLVLEKS